VLLNTILINLTFLAGAALVIVENVMKTFWPCYCQMLPGGKVGAWVCPVVKELYCLRIVQAPDVGV